MTDKIAESVLDLIGGTPLVRLRRLPEPGGWNRIVLEVTDIEAVVATLRADGAVLRNDIVSGPGGRQVVVEDPSGNAIELFQPGAS